MNKASNIRSRIKNGETVVGTFFKINSMDMAEIIGNAGFDFVVVDTEHANFSSCDVANIIRAADGAGLSTIVRVAEPSEVDILHALDSNADGVQIPGIASLEQAETISASTKYCPEGTRGLSLTQRSARYGVWTGKQPYTDYANEHTLVTVHVENKEMAARIEELCEVPQIDVIFVGPADLSQSLGVPGQLSHPELMSLIESVFEKALAKGKAVGIFCGNLDAVKKYREMGATYILYSSDTTLFYLSMAEARKGIAALGLTGGETHD